MIKKVTCFGLVLMLLLGSKVSGENTEKQKLQVVDSVNIKKYCRLWYEIARIPNSFQDQCSGEVTAEYKLREDGKLKIINKCEKENGNVDQVTGIAKIVDTQTNAKLKVSFVNILGVNLFWADYWIIGLDGNYDYAVVGTPERKYGWILSRKPTLPDSTRKEINNLLENKGYDPERFQSTQ